MPGIFAGPVAFFRAARWKRVWLSPVRSKLDLGAETVEISTPAGKNISLEICTKQKSLSEERLFVKH